MPKIAKNGRNGTFMRMLWRRPSYVTYRNWAHFVAQSGGNSLRGGTARRAPDSKRPLSTKLSTASVNIRFLPPALIRSIDDGKLGDIDDAASLRSA